MDGEPEERDLPDGAYTGDDLLSFFEKHVARKPEVDKAKLIALIDDIDRRLSPCTNEAFQMIAYVKPEDLLQPVRDGRLVVISRGMLRLIRQALRQ